MENKPQNAFTIVELIISILIVALISGVIWNIYFSGRETMRYTVGQSQIQSDTRIFLDHLEMDMSACYSFLKVDPDAHAFSFYSFTFSRMPLDELLYDSTGYPKDFGVNSDQRLRVVKYEYSWNKDDGKVTKVITPGYLEFLKTPMNFVAGDPSHFTDYPPGTAVVLKDIEAFDVRAYKQAYDPVACKLITEPVPANDSEQAVFIVLKIKTLREDTKGHRDEELDIVTKFYSQYRIVEAANPGWFSTTDRDGRY